MKSLPAFVPILFSERDRTRPQSRGSTYDDRRRDYRDRDRDYYRRDRYDRDRPRSRQGKKVNTYYSGYSLDLKFLMLDWL